MNDRSQLLARALVLLGDPEQVARMRSEITLNGEHSLSEEDKRALNVAIHQLNIQGGL